jgi:hypothetical protein
MQFRKDFQFERENELLPQISQLEKGFEEWMGVSG